MLRLKVITLWSDLFAELDGVMSELMNGEGANLNLLRRSVVAWVRQAGEPKPIKKAPYHVSLNAEELTQLEAKFAAAQNGIMLLTKDGLKTAIVNIREVTTLAHKAHARSQSDHHIIALVAGPGSIGLRKGLSEAVRIEVFRRGLLKYRSSQPEHPLDQEFSDSRYRA